MRPNFSIPPISATSGNPCTFWGGMRAAATGSGALAPKPLEGCITGALQATATHTAGCVQINSAPSNTYPNPIPNAPTPKK